MSSRCWKQPNAPANPTVGYSDHEGLCQVRKASLMTGTETLRIKSFMVLAAQPGVALSLTAVLALGVGIATLTPQEHMPSAPGGDKLHHFLAFGAVALPLAYVRPRAVVWIMLLVSGYGALIEVIQPHVGRHGDVMDVLANAAGATCGAVLGSALSRWFPR